MMSLHLVLNKNKKSIPEIRQISRNFANFVKGTLNHVFYLFTIFHLHVEPIEVY